MQITVTEVNYVIQATWAKF